jgi:hypothetical protein
MPRQRLQSPIALCLTVALLGLVAAVAAGGNDPALEMWQSQRMQFHNYLQGLKPLAEHRIDDIFRIRTEKRFLVLTTALTDAGGEQSRRATLEGISGTAQVSALRNDRRRGFSEPTRFSLNVADFPAPKMTTSIGVSSSMQPNQLMLSHTVQTTNGPYYTVTFTQSKAPQSNGSGLVMLMINQGHAQGVAATQINLRANDFASLVREHPEETDRYLRPILRELGQEAVFAPDQMVAWQVFSDLWKTDPAVTARVQELLPSLNSDDYRVRDAGLAHLQQLGRDGAAALIHLDRSRLSPEQNARIDRALLPYAQIPPREVAKLRVDLTFLLDCLYSDEVPLRKAAVGQLRTVIRPDLQFDINADAAARSAAIADLRAQLVPSHSQSPLAK